MSTGKLYSFFLTAIGIAFILLLLICAYHNCLAEDDFAFLSSVKQLGILQASVENFNSWNSRWASLLLVNTAYHFLDYSSNLLPYHLPEFTFLFFSVYLLAKSLFEVNGIKMHGRILLPVSIYFCCGFFYASFNKGETWFWVIGSSIYLWSISFACIGVSRILQNRKNLAGYFIIIISGLLVGGSSEVLASTLLAILGFSSCIIAFRESKHRNLLHGMLIFFFAIAAGLAVAFFAEGTGKRRAALPHPGLVQQQWIFIKAMIKLWIFYLPQKILIAAIFGFPFLLLPEACHFRKSFPKKHFIKIAASFFILTMLSLYPVVFILGEMGPERSWTQVSFYLMLASCLAFFMIGSTDAFSRSRKKVVPAVLAVILLWMIADCIIQYSITGRYAAAWHSRMDQLDSLKKSGITGTISLEPLPFSGYLHSAEINADSSWFSNRQLKEALQLPFDVAVKKTVQ